MPGNFKKEDLRVIKTRRAIVKSFESILNRRNFSQITVNDVCTQALVSRTAFYTHFKDKYDLLEYWFDNIWEHLQKTLLNSSDKCMEDSILRCFQERHVALRRLVSEHDSEIISLFLKFFSKCLSDSELSGTTFSDFCAGGLFNVFYIQAQSTASLPEHEIRKTIRRIFKAVRCLKSIQDEKEYID